MYRGVSMYTTQAHILKAPHKHGIALNSTTPSLCGNSTQTTQQQQQQLDCHVVLHRIARTLLGVHRKLVSPVRQHGRRDHDERRR